MGLMEKLRRRFGGRKPVGCDEMPVDEDQLHQWLMESRRRAKDYLAMEASEWRELPESELLPAVWLRTEHRVDACGLDDSEQLAGFLKLSKAQQTIYTLYRFETEMQNGGLCQFFVNSSRMVAPYVSQALAAVGAEDHRRLFDDFVGQNAIDLQALSSLNDEDIEAFEARVDRYPFEAFDDAYYELEALDDLQMGYLKSHLEAF